MPVASVPVPVPVPVPDEVNQPTPIEQGPAVVPPSASDGLTAPEPAASDVTIPADVPLLPDNATPAQQRTWGEWLYGPAPAPGAPPAPAPGAPPAPGADAPPAPGADAPPAPGADAPPAPGAAPASKGWLWGGHRGGRVPTQKELDLIKKLGGLSNLPLGGRRRNRKTSKKGGSRKHKKTAKKGGRRHKKTAKK